MDDAISRSAVLEMAYCAIKPTQDNPSVVSVVNVEYIEKLPALDVAPVVRCKDCCYNYGLVSGAGWCKDDIVCEYHMSDGFADNDFCSHGVKMDGEKNEP